MQLDPQKYNKGMLSAFRQVVAAEGVGVLATGLGATAAGYFVQGFFKFGGVLASSSRFPRMSGSLFSLQVSSSSR